MDGNWSDYEAMMQAMKLIYQPLFIQEYVVVINQR
jgi:hypothetical protein